MMVSHDDVEFVGQNLVRPECVVCNASGRIFTANFDGGVSVIEPDGTTWHLLGNGSFTLKPNGICLEADGSFLVTHLDDVDGGVFRLRPTGDVEPFVLEVEGKKLPPTNFVHRDVHGRVWITVSTRLQPRMKGYRNDIADGFIVLADDRGVRVAADGIGYANECLLHPDGKRLFVNETFSKRVSFFDVADDGTLSKKRVFRELDDGEFPDGLAFDKNGDVWVVCVVSNRLLRLKMDGSKSTVIDDADPERIAWVEAAFQKKMMRKEHLQAGGSLFKNVSSIAFGGPDLRIAYMGCLLGNQIPCFRSPIAGTPPPHWNYNGPDKMPH